jgi:hypothetical protein
MTRATDKYEDWSYESAVEKLWRERSVQKSWERLILATFVNILKL